VEIGRHTIYNPIDRLLCLFITLPISTASVECAFSSMKIIKTRKSYRLDCPPSVDICIFHGVECEDNFHSFYVNGIAKIYWMADRHFLEKKVYCLPASARATHNKTGGPD
jgi:hypothetical protein